MNFFNCFNKKIWWLLLTAAMALFQWNGTAIAQETGIGVILADTDGNIHYSKNRSVPMIPASILKLLTSLAAIHTLGADYHFGTPYALDPDSNDLYIKGKADPLLISEEIRRLCDQMIKTLQIRQVRHIFLDQTYFSDAVIVPGKGRSRNPYDASIGALCANFNTIAFKLDRTKNRFVSAEDQTPLLPVFEPVIVSTGLNQGRIVLPQAMSRLYPGWLIQHFLEQSGILVSGNVAEKIMPMPEKERQTFFSSFTLIQVIEKLLAYSSNYIANQLLMTLGAETYHAPATMEKGLDALTAYAVSHLGLSDFTIREGSGLSRDNRITPEQMLVVLMEFLPYVSVLKHDGNDHYKTGTLSGVRTRAGYLQGSDLRLYPYVIMVNKKDTGYDAILSALKQRIP